MGLKKSKEQEVLTKLKQAEQEAAKVVNEAMLEARKIKINSMLETDEILAKVKEGGAKLEAEKLAWEKEKEDVAATHKFESRYLDSLIGPYPERKDIYKARSPIHHAEGLNCPVIFLQGLEDKVVPPNQAEMMVDILQDKGIKVAHVTFADEGHGFRKAANIIRAMASELRFYKEGFDLAGAP